MLTTERGRRNEEIHGFIDPKSTALNRDTDKLKDRQRQRQTDKQTDRKTERQTDITKHMYQHMHGFVYV